MLELGRKKLPQGKCLVIGGGGCSDGETSLFIRRDHPTVTLSDLQANHEEGDIVIVSRQTCFSTRWPDYHSFSCPQVAIEEQTIILDLFTRKVLKLGIPG